MIISLLSSHILVFETILNMRRFFLSLYTEPSWGLSWTCPMNYSVSIYVTVCLNHSPTVSDDLHCICQCPLATFSFTSEVRGFSKANHRMPSFAYFCLNWRSSFQLALALSWWIIFVFFLTKRVFPEPPLKLISNWIRKSFCCRVYEVARRTEIPE